MADILNRCGEQNGTVYDRRGNYFREGVDPRNHVGRFVNLGIRKVDRHVYWLGHEGRASRYEQRLDNIQHAIALEAVTNA